MPFGNRIPLIVALSLALAFALGPAAPRGPKEWSAFVDAEVTKWADIVRRADVTVQ